MAVLSRPILLCYTFNWRHYTFFPPPSAPAACAQAFLSPNIHTGPYPPLAVTQASVRDMDTHAEFCSQNLQAKEGGSTVCTKHVLMVLGTDP